MARTVTAGTAALCLTLLVLVSAAPLALGAAKPDKGQRVGPAVGKPLIEAQKVAQAGELDKALPLLEVAKLAAKTPFEQFQVNEVYAFVYAKQKNFEGAADAIDGSLALNFYAPDIRKQRLLSVCQMRYTTKAYDKAVTACGRSLTEGGPNADTYILLAQMYRTTKQYRESSEAIKNALKTGAKPSDTESLMEMQFNNYLQMKDVVGQRTTLEALIAIKPAVEYWERLETMVEMTLPQKPRMDLDMARVRQMTGVMKLANEYLDMAQLALDAGLPGEAVSVLKRGAEAGLLGAGGGDKARFDRLTAKARADAADDLKSLAKFDKEAQAAKDGKKDLALGQAYVSHGRNAEGVTAITRALTKGGVEVGEAQLRLGQALLGAGKRTEALQAFEAVPAKSPYAGIASLWSVQARASAVAAN